MIYILTHREIPNMIVRWFTPLHISNNPNNRIELKVRDVYPRMADMNRWYNEMSGQYYIWKEDKTEYKGQVQYRIVPQMSFKEVKEVLETYDFIAHTVNVSSIKTQFCRCHGQEIWDTVYDLLKDKGFEDELLKKWSNSNILFNRNMFIAKADDYNDYSKWLFDILFDLEARLGIKNMDDAMEWAKTQHCMDPNPERLPGYLSERLFTLYLYKRYGSLDKIKEKVYVPQFDKLHSKLPVG